MSSIVYRMITAGLIISFSSASSYARDDGLLSALNDYLKLHLPEGLTRNEELVSEWENLLERCETSIVEAALPNVEGLEEYHPKDYLNSRPDEVVDRVWSYPKGSMKLWHKTLSNLDGVKRSCVVLRPYGFADFSVTEIRDLMGVFIESEFEEVLKETNIFKRFEVYSPEISIWFRRVEKNSNGFCVISRFAASWEYKFAFAGISEADEAECHASAPRASK